MEQKKIIGLSEGLSLQDSINGELGGKRKTQILIGYDRYVDNNGVTQLGETLFDTHNMVPIGGVQYSFEHLFGIAGPITTGYLNAQGIGSQSTTTNTGKGVYNDGHFVCLFGIGTGGGLSNSSTVKEVKYNERYIDDMIPFRYVSAALTGTNATKYFGKKTFTEASKIGYFLKKFDSIEIKHLWLDSGVASVDGTVVDNTVFDSVRTDGIQSFAEMNLTIATSDVKEWFTANGNIEEARVNSIGLFAGFLNTTDNDYEKIKLISKLNIPSEPLVLAKDLAIIYRVFGS